MVLRWHFHSRITLIQNAIRFRSSRPPLDAMIKHSHAALHAV
jgi:hypothetical protein